jgi:hypothetical protein
MSEEWVLRTPDLVDFERVECPDCGTWLRFSTTSTPWATMSMQIVCSSGRILEVAP